MTDWPLPPLYEPRGPRDSDEEVVRAFLRHRGPTPHSERLHVEDTVLRVDGDMPLALWMSNRSVLVLFDVPDTLVDVRARVEAALEGEGLTKLDEQSPLGIAVGMQLVGARALTWDLWGADIDEAFADLRRAAVGGEDDMLFGGGLPPTV
ncbi:MAG TPA: hypothetical protein VHT30_07080 [Acidimicrobiales bacterium]|jgi:hypothetical protein|nr:hypothetical protein [Acidimicrobiales bacterium]